MSDLYNKAGRKGGVGRKNGISRRWIAIPLILFMGLSVSGQAPKTGFTRPLADVKFPQEDKPGCLQIALENGDLRTGPSTAIMKTTPNCVVPAHYHTAEEQLLIVRGEVSTGMEGMRDTLLGPGGFAMMAGKQVHWFSCTGREECLMFVTFDRAYDIVWVKQNK